MLARSVVIMPSVIELFSKGVRLARLARYTLLLTPFPGDSPLLKIRGQFSKLMPDPAPFIDDKAPRITASYRALPRRPSSSAAGHTVINLIPGRAKR